MSTLCARQDIARVPQSTLETMSYAAPMWVMAAFLGVSVTVQTVQTYVLDDIALSVAVQTACTKSVRAHENGPYAGSTCNVAVRRFLDSAKPKDK